jgi:peptidoglycan/LPS O-acetylase OafA/YrhL
MLRCAIMTLALSVYLDLVRFLAALTVMGYHLTFPQFTGGIVSPQGPIGEAGVTCFFVLSGYVIAYVSATKERSLSAFAISRMARIYSVAIPALILAAALDWTGYALGSPKQLPIFEYVGIWKYLPIFLTFTHEVWSFRINVLTAGSYWSLSYEVWYYIAFAVAFYYRGTRRLAFLLPILVFMGSRVLLLFPIWIAGAVVYWLHAKVKLAHAPALALFIASFAALIAIRAFGLDHAADETLNAALGGWPDEYLRYSAHLCGAYMVGACMVANFFSARYLRLAPLTHPVTMRVIRYAASFTFALYLSHRPLLDFLSFAIGHDPHSLASVAELVLMTLCGAWLFGLVSEHKKHLWRALFVRLIGWTRSGMAALTPRLYLLVAPNRVMA